MHSINSFIKKPAFLWCFLFFLNFFPFFLSALHIDLRDPVYSEGVLTTDKGGVISAPQFRVQAQKIHYTMVDAEGKETFSLRAEGEIILEFGEYLFVGEELIYDFQTGSGILYQGRTAIEPWFLGGQEILLNPDGSYRIIGGFATTSENYKMEWSLESEETYLRDHHLLSARNVTFRFLKLPLFWVPSLNLNLRTLFDSPFRYRFRVGGKNGPCFGATYKLFANDNWNTLLNLDYRLKSGFGGGFEAHYRSPNKMGYFDTTNYIAEDRPRFNPKKLTRYRFQGDYHHIFDCGKTEIDFSYDKLSDKEMATDYDEKDLRLQVADPTQFRIRRQESQWILTFLTRFRFNTFQTVKKELPSLSSSFHPFEIKNTGILTQGRVKAGYLEMKYADVGSLESSKERNTAKNLLRIGDYNSTRYEIAQSFWRPLHLGWLHINPEAEGIVIYYGNNPKREPQWLTTALLQIEAHADFFRYYQGCKHVATPYIRYQHDTYPTSSPSQHDIFDIGDGWYRLNALRFGIKNDLYIRDCNGCPYRKLHLDLFTYTFFDTKTIPQEIPKGYLTMIYRITPRLRWTNQFGWDFVQHIIDHYNTLLEWTLSNEAAISCEYRHRSSFDWRKVDRYNFILDSYKDVDALKRLSISDRRDTFLLNFYYRFQPSWAFGVQSRNGWNRKNERDYHEYQVALFGTFRSAWNIKLAYKHREDEDRFSISIGAGLKRPPCESQNSSIPFLEF